MVKQQNLSNVGVQMKIRKLGVNFFKFIIFDAALSDLLVQLKDSFNKVETILNLFEVIFDPQAKLSQC